ncbi:MAG: DUF58 domain-containing protein [Desulfurococcaceae archaeon]
MKISRAGVAAIIINIVSIIYAFSTRSILILSLALLLALLLFMDYSNTRRIRDVVSGLIIKRSINNATVIELGKFTVNLHITNNSNESIPWLKIIDIQPEYVKVPRRENEISLTLPGKASIDICYDAISLAPGLLKYDESEVYVSGYMGFFHDKLIFKIPGHVTSLPLTIDIDIDLRSVERIISTYIRGKSNIGLYDLSNIRDYVSGDDVRKILWRHYARTGKLYVREDYGESRIRTLVILDKAPFDWNIGDKCNTLAHIKARVFSSLINYLIKAGSRVDVVACVDSTVKMVSDIGDSVDIVNRIYSSIPAGGGCTTTVDIYLWWFKYLSIKPEDYDVIIMITSPISLLYNEQIALKRLLSVLADKLHLVMPIFKYNVVLDVEPEKLISSLYKYCGEIGIGNMSFIEENMEVFGREDICS